jgi:hypothetical protein
MKTKITTHSDALNMIASLSNHSVFTVDYTSPTKAVVTHSNGVVVLRATWNGERVTVKHHSKLFA